MGSEDRGTRLLQRNPSLHRLSNKLEVINSFKRAKTSSARELQEAYEAFRPASGQSSSWRHASEVYNHTLKVAAHELRLKELVEEAEASTMKPQAAMLTKPKPARPPASSARMGRLALPARPLDTDDSDDSGVARALDAELADGTLADASLSEPARALKLAALERQQLDAALALLLYLLLFAVTVVPLLVSRITCEGAVFCAVPAA